MTSYRLPVTFLFLLAFLTAACAVDAAPLPVVATNAAPSAEHEPPMPEVGAPVARTALAAWLDIPPESVQIILVESVEWPDASLGCPRPGIAYAQVITPGFRFTLEAGGRSYFVHTDLSDAAIACTEDGVPLAPVLPVVPGEIDDGEPWMPVY